MTYDLKMNFQDFDNIQNENKISNTNGTHIQSYDFVDTLLTIILIALIILLVQQIYYKYEKYFLHSYEVINERITQIFRKEENTNVEGVEKNENEDTLKYYLLDAENLQNYEKVKDK